MLKKLKLLSFCILLFGGFACKEVYKPAIISSPSSYLVIEGVLNTGPAPTEIKLTRTFKLDDTARVQPERNAQVTVEGKDNTTRSLTMTGNGIYTSPDLQLVINHEYRLRIQTVNGKEYLSEYVAARKTPVIDSVGFRREEKGVRIYANAHDDANTTRYYRFEFDETWEQRTFYNSAYKYVNGVVLRRTLADNVSTCWRDNKFTSVILWSTASLESDIVFRAPILFISNGDERLAVRYSVMVRQYALDKRGYEFYEQMRRNTETLGTVFDAQPSETRGNFYSTTDPKEFVIGYLSASTIEEKRYFIERSQVPDWRFIQDCPEVPIENAAQKIKDAYDEGLSIYGMLGFSHYQGAKAECVDCTARGGSLIKPSFW
ncbi:MAG: DUF4249 domain-containing protein [Chitinophagaceae bacterium]|nr:MAG: DUF4249 domain-containing protein [Chitinophagaceae bacterium]